MRWIVAHPQPRLAIVPLLGADDRSSGLVALRCEQFIVAIIGANDIEHIGKSVGVIAAHVGPEQRLRHRPRGIVRVTDLDQAFQNRFGEIGLGRVVDFIADAVENDARMISVAADGVGGDGGVGVAEVRRAVSAT